MRIWVVLQLLMDIATLIAKVSDFWLEKTPFFGSSAFVHSLGDRSILAHRPSFVGPARSFEFG